MRMRVEYYRYIKDPGISLEGKIATWKFMISKFGEDPELYRNIADAYRALNKPGQADYYDRKARDF